MKPALSSGFSDPKPTFLTAIVVVSIVTIVLFPLFMVFQQYPNISRLLEEFPLKEAVGVAQYLSTAVIQEDRILAAGSLSEPILDRIRALERDAHFVRLVIYSPSGRILYSSDPGQIGEVNQDPYFQGILALKPYQLLAKSQQQHLLTIS